MSLINVCMKKDNNMTSVSNDFIKNYLPKANSLYVKIYLYMLMLSSSNESIDMENVAKTLDVFESEIVKVLSSLSKEGYCTFKKDGDTYTFSPEVSDKTFKSEIAYPKISEKLEIPYEDDEASTIEVKLPLSDSSFVESGFINDIKNEIKASTSLDTICSNNTIESEELNTKQTMYDMDCLSFVLKCNTEISDVVEFIETNYGCMFSPNDIQALVSISEAEYVSNECLKTLVSYIYKNKSVSKIGGVLKTLETIAISLNEKGITDKALVEDYLNSSSKNYMQVFKHLGLAGRLASEVEKNFIDKWLYKYKISLPVILEACDKTILAINEPSFNYVERILSSWKDKNIRTINDLRKMSTNDAVMPSSSLTSSKKSKFANYDEQKVNYDNFDNTNTEYLMKKYGR